MSVVKSNVMRFTFFLLPGDTATRENLEPCPRHGGHPLPGGVGLGHVGPVTAVVGQTTQSVQ